MPDFIIKVLSGPHVGAQAAISSEPLVIGTAEACDLVLPDPHIGAKHAELALDGKSGCSVKSIDGPVLIDGTKVASPATLKFGQVLTLGSTHLAVGPRETTWPSIRLPLIRQIEKPEPAAVLAAGSTPGKPVAKPHNPPPAWLAAVIIAVLSSSVGVTLWLIAPQSKDEAFSATQEEALDKADNSAGVALEEALKQKVTSKVPGITATFREQNGVRTLYLWGNDSDSLSRARAMANKSDVTIPVQLVNMRILEASLKDLTDMFSYRLTATCTPGATVEWSGYLKDRDAWKVLESRIATDIPLVTENITKGIYYGSEIKESLEKIALAQGVAAALTYDIGTRQITVNGALTPTSHTAWSKELNRLKGTLGGDFIVDAVQTDRSEDLPKEIFGAAIIGLSSTGPMPWVALADGQRLFEGALLKSGLTLAKIEANRLLVQGDGRQIQIPVDLTKDKTPPAAAQVTPKPKNTL